MGWVTDRATMLVLVVALGIGPWGCAHTKPRAAQPPSDDVRSELGTIGVAPASGAPPAPLMAPTRGKAAGALKGAGGGFVAGATPGLYLLTAAGSGCIGGGGGQGAATLCALVIMTGLGVATAGGTVGAVGGTVYGLVAADSASTIAAAEDALTRAAADVDVQRSLREHVLRELGEHGSLTFVDLGERTAADGAPEDHRRWKHDGIDTVLDVTVSQLGLAGGSGVKPRVGVSMVARARLIRTADGVEVYGRPTVRSRAGRPTRRRRSVRSWRQARAGWPLTSPACSFHPIRYATRRRRRRSSPSRRRRRRDRHGIAHGIGACRLTPSGTSFV